MKKVIENKRRVHFDQICLDLANRSTTGSNAYFVLLSIFIFSTDYHQSEPFIAYSCLAFHLFCMIFRLTLFLKFTEIVSYNKRLWYLFFCSATLIVAGGWSLFWLIILLQGGISNFLVLGLVATVGTVAGGTATLSSDLKLVFFYQFLMLWPLCHCHCHYRCHYHYY